jgi:site-specific recombinase XerD
MIADDELSRAFLLERFGDFLTLEQGAAVRTTDAYARDVGRFVTSARAKGVRAPLGASPRLLRDFV